MLLIVTIGLVLAGVVLLVVGFLTNSLGYIYAAIVCAAVAGVALLVFSRLTRRRATRLAMAGAGGDTRFLDGRETARPGPAAQPRQASDGETRPERVPAGAGVGVADLREPAAPQPQPQAEPAAAMTAERPVAAAQPAAASPPGPPDGASGDASDDASDDEDVFGDWDDDLIFPIEDYDQLQVSQILPLLDELEPDELEDVRDREQHGAHRDAVLQRIGGLLGEPVAPPAPPAPPAPSASSAPAPSASSSADQVSTPPARNWPPPAGAPAPAPAGAPAASAAPEPDPAPAAGEPIPGYATMRISDILSHLNGLSPDQLAAVEAQERAGSRRSIVLTRINKLRAQT